MLHKCANAACTNLFRSLSVGKLFLLETDTARQLPRSLPGVAGPFASPPGTLLAVRWLLFLTHPDL